MSRAVPRSRGRTLASSDPEMLELFTKFVLLRDESNTDAWTIDTALWMTREYSDDLRAQLWIIGMFTLTLELPIAEILTHELRDDRKWLKGNLDRWIAKNIKRVTYAYERRDISGPKRFAEAIWSLVNLNDEFLKVYGTDQQPKTYHELKDLFDSQTKHYGRYVFIRWAEMLRRLLDVPEWSMSDIMPEQAEHPRMGLAMIYPEARNELVTGTSAAKVVLVNSYINDLVRRVKDSGAEMDVYTAQWCLCVWKKFQDKFAYYHEVNHDMVLRNIKKTYRLWPEYSLRESMIFPARAATVPHHALGEMQGWKDVRDDIRWTYWEYGYFWSDKLYNYSKTTDLTQPVKR